MSRRANSKLGSENGCSKELMAIVDAYCDDRATAEEIEQLEKLLNEDCKAVQDYINYVGVHTALDWCATSRELLPTQSPHLQTDKGVLGRLRDALTKYQIKDYGILAICAVLLVALTVSWVRNHELSSSSAGSLSASVAAHSEDARWIVLGSNAPSEGMRRTINRNDTVHLTSGQLQLCFQSGAEVSLTGPAVLQVISPSQALAVSGRLTANVPDQAIGFSIDTPRAQVVDLGTRFGLDVDGLGQTDVVVFEGEVDICYGPIETQKRDWTSRVMHVGEAVRVDDRGAANRIMSINSTEYTPMESAVPLVSSPLITGVYDNIRSQESWNYYEIVHCGMREDARAYVDRISHEWNGVESAGMPKYLIGGDYVKMFNNDKYSHTFELSITLSRQSLLYVLFDDRIPPPEWLQKSFTNTGDHIGIDRGPYRHPDGKLIPGSPGVGPGQSVEDTLSVWVKEVKGPGEIVLGSTETPHNFVNMYGIVATEYYK